ncbi:MAG: FAD binding domain-containing protein [Longimicrobiales bacterium]|nr:FAD binding domain-containing protein [Longimicrobiales bacterium]
MLRLPAFRFHRPGTLQEALTLLHDLGPEARPVAGGTDLIPNLKHRLLEPTHLVSLTGIPELGGIRLEGEAGGEGMGTGSGGGSGGGQIVLGAAVTLAALSRHPLVRQHLPALAQAASQVAGPQIRSRGTVGGNLCLDTRCTYYNQTEFWRGALGYCLKKDGTVCHVTRVGRKCVAAHSADTPPVLMTLGAVVDIAGPGGERTVPVGDFFLPDGIWNQRREPGELVVRIRVPLPHPTTRMAYRKLRQRRSIDFPLLSVAVSGEVEEDLTVRGLRGVVGALGARPRELTGWEELAVGERLGPELIEALAERAHRQCHPLENIIVDPDWRRAMVPVFVRRALQALAGREPGKVGGDRWPPHAGGSV